MFQDLRTGYASLLGYVSDQDDRDSGLLCEAQQHRRRLLDLGHRPRRRLDILRIHRLYRIHDHKVRHHGTGLGDYVLHEGLAVYHASGIIATDARGTQLHLLRAFLARDIKGPELRAVERDLEGKGRFSDTRFAADKHQ